MLYSSEAHWANRGRVRLGSIRNKNNWNNASKRLFGSYSHSGIPGFHSGYSAPRSRIAGIYSGIYSYSGKSQTNAPGKSRWWSVADLGEGPEGTGPLFWVKREEMTEGRKAGWASKLKPGPLLNSKSGFITDDIYSYFGIDMDISKGEFKSAVKRWRQKWSGMDARSLCCCDNIVDIPFAICTAERSFSSMKGLKTLLWSTVTDRRLSSLANLFVHLQARGRWHWWCYNRVRPS